MKANKGFSIILSFGRFGGFYYHRGFSIRLCLGWVAFTYLPKDIDELLNKVA